MSITTSRHLRIDLSAFLLALLLAPLLCVSAHQSHAQAPTANTAQPSQGTPEAPTQPSMALGLNGIAYWGTSFPFINLMKQAAGGAMSPVHGAPAGTQPLGYDAMASAGLLDANGWPTSLPKHMYWHAIVTADAGEVPSQKGRYVLRYRGEGKVRVLTNGSVRSESPGEIHFDISSDNLYIEVQIQSSDPQATGDYVRDIAVVKHEHIALHEAGLLFNPQWLALIRDMRVLRFMDWQFTNGSVEQHWAQRPTLDSNTWGVTLERKTQKGVPVEAMVALANHTGSDPWFTLPLQATDDYVAQFAAYVATHLDPKLMAYFEYSNEVWNWIFPQTRMASDAGIKQFGTKHGEAPLREYYGYRSAEISDIVHRAFGEQAAQRVHFTLATQTDDNDYPLMLSVRGAEEYLKSSKRKIADVFDSVAVTWYFNIEPHLHAQIAAWIKKFGDEKARNMLFEQLRGSEEHFQVASPNDAPTIAHMLAGIEIQAKFARQHQLPLISYEGGTHLMGYEQYNEPLADFFIKTNNDARMGEIYSLVLKGWQKIPGATLLNHFVEVGAHSKWGSWGALRHLEDQSARWDFIVATNQIPATWEKRADEAFQQGKLALGDARKQTLEGNARADFLSGGDGEDILRGGAGNDGLHGGDGDDVIEGGPGDDVLVPGVGADRLRGGPGKDHFVFTFPLGKAANTIEDFSPEDVLDFRQLLINVPVKASAKDYFSLTKIEGNTHLLVDLDGPEELYSPLSVIIFSTTPPVDLEQMSKQGRLLFH